MKNGKLHQKYDLIVKNEVRMLDTLFVLTFFVLFLMVSALMTEDLGASNVGSLPLPKNESHSANELEYLVLLNYFLLAENF